MPVTRTQEKTHKVVNTHVQHVVNTVKVEKPEIIKETVRGEKPVIQEKINHMTKHIDVPVGGAKTGARHSESTEIR